MEDKKDNPHPAQQTVAAPSVSHAHNMSVERIEWETHEHEHREHSQDWFWIVWIVAVSVAIGAILFSNLLFAALAIVSAFVMSLFASKHPELVKFTISHRGIQIDKRLYPFSSLHSFAIREDEEEHDGRYLLVQSKRHLVPMIIIPVPESVSTREIRNFLLEELPESELHLPFSERLMELVGF